jgi:esterase/lipase
VVFDTESGQFEIREEYYKWCSWLYEALRDRLGLNIKVHPDTELLQQGHIFLFNHFARFETVFPPYLLYRHTGTFTRSIADYRLFTANEWLDKLLRGLGVVPNNQPGLLAFLAAEVLRGRKVSVFPEGGMVKDRRVLIGEDKYGIQFPSAAQPRGHHRGAAVLALTLDIFKKRILELHKQGDTARLGRWVEALGLEDEQQLLTRAREPTLIVPSTITFYPLGIQENALSRMASLLAKDLPQKAAEELLIEGNLVLRDTDMDIRLNPPISPDRKWSFWEKWLLNRYFLKVDSLEQFFSLRDHAETFTERVLVKSLSAEATRLRDLTMRALYVGTSINLSHLASQLITSRLAQGHMAIGVADFHRALYVALKELQAIEGVHLHRSLSWPDRYRGLLDGECRDLERFLETCSAAGLLRKAGEAYEFLEKLRHPQGFHEVRLENPILVYTNEAAPIPAVRVGAERALKRIGEITEQNLAAYLFDDELRAHEWNRQHFSAERYRAVNETETATESGAPFLLGCEQRRAKGVLLVHGLLASPAELAQFGQHLKEQGYAVMGVRIAGHGTSPWDLKNRDWGEWLASVRGGYRILSAFADTIVVVGFSAGAALSLILAAERPAKLAGVASVSAPLAYRNRKLALVPLVQGINRLAGWIPNVDSATTFVEYEAEHPDINYHNVPIYALHQLRAMTAELQKRLPEIKAETLVLQGDDDPVVDPSSAQQIFDRLQADKKTLRWIPSGRHGILNEDIGGTCAAVEDFIAKTGSSEPLAGVRPQGHARGEGLSRSPALG